MFAGEAETRLSDETIYTTIIEREDEEVFSKDDDVSLEDVPEDELMEYCPPVSSRNLFWKLTRGGKMMIQPCPNGSTGLARWQCVSGQHGNIASWSPSQPDLSDCKSVSMTNLEVKVR